MWGTVMIKSRFALILAAGAAMQFAALSQPASAADLPTGSLKDTPYVVVPSWQGLYFGGHAGGVWGNTGVHDNFTYVGDPTFNRSLEQCGLHRRRTGRLQRPARPLRVRPGRRYGLSRYIGKQIGYSSVPGSCIGYYNDGPDRSHGPTTRADVQRGREIFQL